MKLTRRVQALESTILRDPIVLHFADGSTCALRGPRYFMLRILKAVGDAEGATAWELEQLELIRRCVSAREPGGAHMVELVKVMLLAAESEPNPEYDKCDA
jgi:hypothetical protein